MALPSQRDSDETRKRLGEWLSSTVGADAEVGELGGPAYNGYSHETLIFEATSDGQRRKYVARVEPSSHSIFFEQDVIAEARVMRAMSGSGVLAPRVHWDEPDPSWLGAPFVVMEHVAGNIPADNPPYTFGGWVLEASPQEQATLWWTGMEAMAAVHGVDRGAPGLEGLIRPDGEPGADAELRYIRGYIDRVTQGVAHPTMDRALAWLEASRPSDEPLGVCWGDSRIGNQIFDGARCAALLDWEMAAIGNPEQDLAWFLYFDRLFSEGLMIARPPGFPGHPETLARYEQITGIAPRNVGFYEILASLRFAIILMRLGQLMVWNGQLPEDTDFGTNSFAMQFLAKLLDERGA
jgi:aminoglycoside phosphotransferase (APT) family kinase protein